jgi:hypothetical protein
MISSCPTGTAPSSAQAMYVPSLFSLLSPLHKSQLKNKIKIKYNHPLNLRIYTCTTHTLHIHVGHTHIHEHIRIYAPMHARTHPCAYTHATCHLPNPTIAMIQTKITHIHRRYTRTGSIHSRYTAGTNIPMRHLRSSSSLASTFPSSRRPTVK